MAIFKDGSHSPTGLIVLQSLVNLIGQVKYEQLLVFRFLIKGIVKETFQRQWTDRNRDIVA